MAYTLSDAKQLSQDKLTQDVIDEFRKTPLLDEMVFDDTATSSGGQSLTYSYNRVTTQPGAGGRAINTEYTPDEAKTTQFHANLVPFGGAFQVDRVLIKHERQVIDLLTFQLQQKIKATAATFCDWFVNGDSAGNDFSFDGLDKALTGSSTERTPATVIDMSTAAAIKSNWDVFLYEVQQVFALMDGTPDLMFVNATMYAVWQQVAMYATQCQETRNEMGTPFVKFGATGIMKMGDKPGSSTPIIGNTTSGSDLVTDLYFSRIGLDALHGVSPDGQQGPTAYMPDLTAPGAVKKGEVEMVAAVALKATRAAGVLRGIKIG